MCSIWRRDFDLEILARKVSENVGRQRVTPAGDSF